MSTTTASTPGPRSPSAGVTTRSSASTRCRRSTTSRACPSRSRSCSRTCCATRTARRSAPQDIEALARWNAQGRARRRDRLHPRAGDHAGLHRRPGGRRPGRHARRDGRRWAAMPAKINPLVPAELVIDHSVQVDVFGTAAAFARNAELEFERNRERYAFLRWGQGAFHNFRVVPPDTGIVHQVNLEYLARVVFVDDERGQAYPDTLVGTDSHTTMVNGLGVLGWGVGGIEAEAAMLGQPMSMLIPQVIGFKLTGELEEGATATDLVLTVTEMLRAHGVVGKFVEFYGHGPGQPAAGRPRHDRQHVARVRLDLRDLPDRRRDAALPGVLGPAARADRARRGLRAGAGPVARRELGGADLHRHARARPRRRRPEHRRPEAPAGPRLADRVQAGLPAWRSRATCPTRTTRTRRWRRASRPAIPCPRTCPTARATSRRAEPAAPRWPSAAGPACR